VDRKVSAATRIEVITDGLFTRRILNDPELKDVGAVLFDEFHERRLNSDLGLALALEAQGALREDLRLLIMSATLDIAAVSKAIAGPVIESAGRQYPVETRYLGRSDERIEDRMPKAIRQALREEAGSVLAFLPGARLGASFAAFGGSAITGTPPSDFYDTIAMRQIGFTAAVVGNHAFALGPDVAARFAEKSGTTGRIVSTGNPETRVEGDSAVIRDRRRWLAADGLQICTDQLAVRITSLPNGSLWEVSITLEAPADGPLVLGDTKEGAFALRLARWMTLPHRAQGRDEPGVGQMVNSAGGSGAGIWGKRAEWVDYFAPREGQVYGVAFFDAPTNPRHPTWWHVRDYGLFAANPFGRHDFEGLKAQPRIGDLTVPAGQSITFRYGVYIHLGDTAYADVARKYRQFAER
jgi:hypothetical protein